MNSSPYKGRNWGILCLLLVRRSLSLWTAWAQTSPHRRAWKGCPCSSRWTHTATTVAAAGPFTGPSLRSRSSVTRWRIPADAGGLRMTQLKEFPFFKQDLRRNWKHIPSEQTLLNLQGAERKLRDEERKQLRKRTKGKHRWNFKARNAGAIFELVLKKLRVICIFHPQ